MLVSRAVKTPMAPAAVLTMPHAMRAPPMLFQRQAPVSDLIAVSELVLLSGTSAGLGRAPTLRVSSKSIMAAMQRQRSSILQAY